MTICAGNVRELHKRYNKEGAKHYLEKHRRGFWRRVSNWGEHRMAARALAIADSPLSVLDIPCGAGRFWDLLARVPDRVLMAADHSQDMINTALKFQPPPLVARFKTFRASAFDIGLPDASVDCVFCMRLLHHLDKEKDRAKMLGEFHRVSRDSVCVSLWVDGNMQAFRRRRSRIRHPDRRDKSRFLLSRSQVESEFVQNGFKVVGFTDLFPRFSMWRTYVLRRR